MGSAIFTSSLQQYGDLTPLYITEERRVELELTLRCIERATDSPGNNVNSRHYWSKSSAGEVWMTKALLAKLRMRYVASFNPGWYKQLGMTLTNQGNYEV